MCWHPSGEVLVSTSYDDSIKLWVDAGDEWVCAQTLAGGLQLPSNILWKHRLNQYIHQCGLQR